MEALQSPNLSVPQPQSADIVVRPTLSYGGGWEVVWAGHIHGGTSRRWVDAALHAQELRESERWDYEQWCEAHGVGVA